MKRFAALLLCVVCVIALPLVSFAHSGGTDSSGGHYDHKTGEYHYHHGMPAHSHWGDFCTMWIMPIVVILFIALIPVSRYVALSIRKIRGYFAWCRIKKVGNWSEKNENEHPHEGKPVLRALVTIGFALFLMTAPVFIVSLSTNIAPSSGCEITPVPISEQEFLYSGAVTYYRSGERLSTLKILSGGISNYVFVALVPINGDTPAVTAYIHENDTISFPVPRGVYDVYFAEGNTYYGSNDLFGSKGIYYKLDNPFVSNKNELKHTVIVNALNREDQYTFVNHEDFPRIEH